MAVREQKQVGRGEIRGGDPAPGIERVPGRAHQPERLHEQRTLLELRAGRRRGNQGGVERVVTQPVE
jgi:hypothetical protein